MGNIIADLINAGRDFAASRREDKSFTLLSPDDIKAATQDIPFSRYGASGGAIQIFQSEADWDNRSNRLSKYQNTKIDFAREVGDLTDSSLVMAAVRWLGKNLPEAPLRVFEKDGKGKESPVVDHPLIQLLKKPTEYYSGQTLWKSFAGSWIISGNVYLQKLRNAFDQVIGLRFWPPYQIRPHWPADGSTFIDYYQVRIDTVLYRIPPEDIVHFRDGLDPITRCGVSPLNSVLREIYSDNEIANFSAILLKNLGVAPFAVVSKDSSATLDVASIKDTLERSITGDNRGRIPVIDGPLEFKQLGQRVKDMSLETMGGRPETRVPAVIGINAIVLYLEAGLNRSIFHNVSEAREEAIEQYLIPLHRYIDEELELQLLPEWGDTTGLAIKHDYREVRALQPDADRLFSRWGLLFQRGGVTRAKLLSETGQEFDPVKDNVYYMSRGAGLVAPEERLVPAGDVTGTVSDKGSQGVTTPTPTRPALKAAGTKKVPSAQEQNAAVEWWKTVAPAGAHGLMDAAVKPNGHAGA